MKIAFHSSYLGFRGTEVALMDYAWGNREFLGNQSLFLLPWREGVESHPVLRLMQQAAPLRLYRTGDEREAILREERADFFYCVKNGWNDGVFSRALPTGIHAIFRESEFHGDIYAYVSRWLSRVMAYEQAGWVPHMVRLAPGEAGLRTELGIPESAMVYGRHGGEDSFDIPWVQQVVVRTAQEQPGTWFLFMNTRTFPGAERQANIRFLPASADPQRKRKFLNSCNAMLHGRMRGETFGLACLEFAMAGRPVLTYAGSPEQAHFEILGDAAVPYHSAHELRELFRHSAPVGRPPTCQSHGAGKGWRDGIFRSYQPEAVMRKFQEVFLG